MNARTSIDELKRRHSFDHGTWMLGVQQPQAGATEAERQSWLARNEALSEERFKTWLAGRRFMWLPEAAPCLLIPMATGVVFHVQAGGHACLQFSMESLAIPIATPEPPASVLHPGPAWQAWARATAPEIEEDLRNGDNSLTVYDLKIVDHKDNTEAWMWIGGRFRERNESFLGVLTWPNSD